MNFEVPISYYIMPQEVNSLSQFLTSLKLKRNTMLFLSKGCYEIIKLHSTPFGEKSAPVSAKKFVQFRDDIYAHDYFSFVPMYSGEWFYLEDFCSNEIKSDFVNNLPKEIKFISLKNEFIPKNVVLNIINPPDTENPLDCIINDFKKFKNSLLILSEGTFKKLKGNISIISYHKGFYRLMYEADTFYPGGIITLRSFNNSKFYLLENMAFPFFNKIFSVQNFPDSIHFIL